jgi:hypothetical protein
VRDWLLTGNDFRPRPTPGYADARQ